MNARAGTLYRYNPTLGDIFLVDNLTKGQIVRAIAPRQVGLAKAILPRSHKYVTDIYGESVAMVFTNSLEPIGTHGEFIHNGSTYHYEKCGAQWECWKDGEDDCVCVANSFFGLFGEI